MVSFLAFTNMPFVVGSLRAVKDGLGIAIGPALSTALKPMDVIGGLFSNYVNLVGTKKENEKLKKDLGKVLLENQKLSNLERENRRLKALLSFIESKPPHLIAAQVTGEDLKNWFRCIIVNKGKNNGIRQRMPVITPVGIVGQAVEVDRWHSKVMVINDVNSSVDVNVEGKNTRGILEGTGGNALKLKYVVKNDEIEIGDKLSTSGKDGIFPKGIPVGIVFTVDKKKAGIFADIDVIPFNDFRQLDEVLIVKK